MPIELVLVILFGILTSLFGLLQLCIAAHKYCVWCRSLRSMDDMESQDVSAFQSTGSNHDTNGGPSASSEDSFVTCQETAV